MEKGTIRIVYMCDIAVYYNEKLTQVTYKAREKLGRRCADDPNVENLVDTYIQDTHIYT